MVHIRPCLKYMMEIKEQVNCFLGVQSFVEETGEQAIKDWDAIFSKIIEISHLGNILGHLCRLYSRG